VLHNIETPLRLLAVEDDPTDRSWLELMLKDASVCPYVMRFVGTMADAVAALKAGEYDCVLLDLSLPDCEGIESVRRVLDARPAVPIVVFTGRKDQEVGLRSIEAGAQDYLVKGQASGNTILQAARWASVRSRSRGAEGQTRTDLEHRMAEAWVTVGLDLRVTAANTGFLQTIGVNETEVLGSGIASFLMPEEAERTTSIIHRLGAVGAAASVVTQVELVHRLGDLVPRTLIATPVRSGPDAADPVVGLFVMFASPAPPPPPPPPPPPAGAATATPATPSAASVQVPPNALNPRSGRPD